MSDEELDRVSVIERITKTVHPGSTGILAPLMRFAALCMNSGHEAGLSRGITTTSQNAPNSGCSNHTGCSPR